MRTHIEFWSTGGRTTLTNLVSLCHYHHRQVHESGWQVVKAGNEFHFLPPERLRTAFARGPDLSQAA